MAADYDRLFQPSDEADAAEDAGGYGDFDVDGPFPTPPGPPSTPQPNGHGASPMPIDPPVQPPPAAAPEHPLMPVDLAAPPPPAAARPPMPVDYDRLFEPPAGTDTSDGPGADATYDPDVPAPTPPTPTNAPKPNGQAPPPMPVHWPEQSPPEHPPMPVDLTAAPPPPTRPEPPGPKERNQVAKQPPRHARQGPAEVPNLQLGRARSHNSHRAAPQPGKGNAPGPSLPSRPLISAHADSAPATASSEPATRPTAGKPAARPVSRRGWRRWVHTLTRINLGLPRDEKYALELQNRIRRPIHGSYEIGVLGLKGGAGRTSVTAALGSAFAQVRGDRILAVDADPVSGDLVNRVGRQTAATVADLVANRALSHYNDVRAHTSVNAVNLEVLSAADYNGTRPLLSAEEWKRALGMVPRYYNLVVSDCGADLFSPAAHGVLAVASGLVVLSTASVDGVRQAAVALDWLRNNGYGALLDRACVVINHVVPGDSTNADSDVVRQFQRHFQPGRVIVLPWDEHIAAGTEVQFALLSTAYQRKIIELAAALSDDFDRSERR